MKIPGNPLQSSSTGVDCLESRIFLYFSTFVCAACPCHGKLPRRKYMITYKIPSKSSLRLCSHPRWVFMDA